MNIILGMFEIFGVFENFEEAIGYFGKIQTKNRAE